MSTTKQNLFYHAQGYQALEIKGKDSQDFLNRLTSADFRSPKPKDSFTGTLLQPNGKMLLFFRALVVSQDHYLLLIPPGLENAGCDFFERLHFRESLTIAPQSNQWFYLRAFTDQPIALPSQEDLFIFNEASLNKNFWYPEQSYPFNFGIVGTSTSLQKVIEQLTGFKMINSIESLRILAGEPAFPNELGPLTIPLEADLDESLMENKCYPGQEVIERIRSTGKVPRRLVLVKGTETLPAAPVALALLSKGAQKISATFSQEEAGMITSTAPNPIEPGWVGLGFIKKVYFKRLSESFQVSGQPVQIQLKNKAVAPNE